MGEHRSIRELQRSGPAQDAPVSALRRAPLAPGEAVPYVSIHEEPTVLIASVGDCLITVVHTLTPAGVAALARAMPRLIERHQGFRSLSIAERKTGSEAVGPSRAAASELVRKYTLGVRGGAVVSESTGFRATAVRSMVTAVLMAGRASHPNKVFDAVAPAIAWLATTRTDLPLDVRRLEQAVALLRARLRAKGEHG